MLGGAERVRVVLVAIAALLLASSPVVGTAEDVAGEATLRIAYPEEPVGWHVALSEHPPTVDLTALWGLPLYRYDHHGQLRPVLVASSAVHPGASEGMWEVELSLREGRWSDGVPVTARDVAATVEALEDTALADELRSLREVITVDDSTVRLVFDRPEPRWPHLLAGARSVLPTHVLDDGGLDAYADGPPVSAGPFRLVEHDQGLRAVFEAHPDGPLGAPGLERVEVYFTPSYETALGLLAQRRVDAVAGYLAPNAVARAHRVDDVAAAAPLGGTWAALAFAPDGTLGGDAAARRGARDGVSATPIVEGLLGAEGEVMTSPVPGLDGPWGAERTPAPVLAGLSLSVVIRGRQEVAGVSARILQSDLSRAGAEVELVRLDLDEGDGLGGDATFRVHRSGPRPSLVSRLPDGTAADLVDTLEAADRAARLDGPEGERALEALHDAAWEQPLYRVAVAHVWRPDLVGVRASAWPGIGFWEVETWRWDGGGPPEQRPTLDEVDDGG